MAIGVRLDITGSESRVARFIDLLRIDESHAIKVPLDREW